MAGTRRLTESEIKAIKYKFTKQRDRTLFVVGCKTGFRISELLSIKIGDVYKFNEVVKTLRIKKDNVKGKSEAKEMPLHHEARMEIERLLGQLDDLNPEHYLFMSITHPHKAISRVWAHRALKNIVNGNRFQGKIAWHSCRKTLASKVYKASGNDLLVTQRALNHKSILSTIEYLDVNKQEVDSIILD